MGIIISMNDETYTPCTKCGRPMAYCKGQCCGQPKGCSCQEYGPMKAGCLREIEPSCPYQAVIPTLTVEDKSNLKDLADCFVHVSNINTTFYIDDKHRMIVTWAGPVEYDNYDLDANSLGLRSQFLIDHANDLMAYYTKTGEYQIIGGANDDEPIYIALSFQQTDGWPFFDGGLNIDFNTSAAAGSRINTRVVPSATFSKYGAPETTYTPEEVFNMLEAGKDVVFMGVPLEWTGRGMAGMGVSAPQVNTDNLRMTSKRERLNSASEDSQIEYTQYSGIAFPSCYPMGYGMLRTTTNGVSEYLFFAQGIDTYTAPN